jgi:hypothetical protein
LIRRSGILLGHPALNLDCTAHCIDRASELDQQAVTGGFYYPPSMRRYGGINEGFLDSL